jgi:signal peptidase II
MRAKLSASALILLLLVSCDHGTKHLAKAHLEGRQPLEVVPGVFHLRYTENTDTAFSLLQNLIAPAPRFWILSALMIAAVITLVAFLAKYWPALSRVQRAGGLMILGGAFGNVSDRLARGYVVDFLHLQHWPVFNVADVAICVGGLLLALGAARQTRVPATPT